MPATKQKVEFTGSQGNALAGLLETPADKPHAYVLFAHCFTCGKDIAAASRVARELVSRGFAVFRFDFTGLGSSDGDFANTNFSSNIQDLVLAASFLRESYEAPSLLIGHSLGGTAVLNAARLIPETRGLVTIGSPASAEHVAKQFACDIESIERDGEATVSLAGREFTIKKQFVDDIREHQHTRLNDLKLATLVMHSPIDNVVSITEAEKIYVAARHPKSFVSLDNADHLLSRKTDANYVAETIAAWASRYISTNSTAQPSTKVAAGEVTVKERDRKFTQDVFTDSHHWVADEPISIGGKNLGPDPYEQLLAALGTCTTMTVRMYAERKKWPVDKVSVTLKHSRKHGDDCAQCDEEHPRIDLITRSVTITGDLDDQQRQRLLEIADKCPVHRTLHNKLVVETALVEQAP